jgi:hypothetical protein
VSLEVFEMIEIDVPKCTRTFGVLPCTAALSASQPYKCWNLRAHCGDPANYFEGTPLTLRLAHDGPLPTGVVAFPVLQRASITSTTVNIAGANPSAAALGRRGTLTFTLSDFLHDDVGIDPYQAERISGAAVFGGVGYDPYASGSFLQRLRSRWPFYAGKEVRLVRGYLSNGVLSDVQTRHFHITEMTGPNDGSVSVTALDVLDLANEKTALAPKPSPGVLYADLSATDTVFGITPTGSGPSYATEGRLCIGSEVMDFTRSGDVFTVVRGQRNTQAIAHSTGDTVQQSLSYVSARVDAVASDLILNFTGTPATYLDAAQRAIWDAEVTRWGSSVLLTTDILTPTPVATLMSELGDLGCTIWPDDLNQKINLRMNRPLDGEVARVVADDTAISVDVEDRDADRLTQVIFFGKRFDPTKSLTDDANYSIKMLTVDPESYTLYGGVKSRKIYTRWLDQGDETTMAIVSKRLLKRFKSAPKTITVKLDAKDKDAALLDVISLTTEALAGPDGQAKAQTLQVFGRSEPTPYVDVELLCQTFDFAGKYCFIAPAATPVFGAASAAEKARYMFISADTAPYFSDGSDAYRIA